MSVINNVLRDLETRESRFTPIDVSSVQATAAAQRQPRGIYAIGLGAALLAAMAGLYLVQGESINTTLSTQTGAEPAPPPIVKAAAGPINQIVGLQIRETPDEMSIEFALQQKVVAYLKARGENSFGYHLRDIESRIDTPILSGNPWVRELIIEPRQSGVDINFITTPGILVETAQVDLADESVWSIVLRAASNSGAGELAGIVAADDTLAVADAELKPLPAATAANVNKGRQAETEAEIVQPAPVAVALKSIATYSSADNEIASPIPPTSGDGLSDGRITQGEIGTAKAKVIIAKAEIEKARTEAEIVRARARIVRAKAAQTERAAFEATKSEPKPSPNPRPEAETALLVPMAHTVLPNIESAPPVRDDAGMLEPSKVNAEVKVEIKATDPRAIAQRQLENAVDLIASRRYGDGAKLLQNLLGSAEDYAAREHLLALFRYQKRSAQFNRLLQSSLLRYPEDPLLQTEQGRRLLQQADYFAVIALLADQPGLGADRHALLATSYQRLDQHQQAIQHYRLALAQEADNGKHWIGLGISQEHLSAHADALNSYRRARRLGNLDQRLRAFVEKRSKALAQVLN